MALNYFQLEPLKVEVGVDVGVGVGVGLVGSKGQTKEKKSRDLESRAGFLGSVKKTSTVKTSTSGLD